MHISHQASQPAGTSLGIVFMYLPAAQTHTSNPRFQNLNRFNSEGKTEVRNASRLLPPAPLCVCACVRACGVFAKPNSRVCSTYDVSPNMPQVYPACSFRLRAKVAWLTCISLTCIDQSGPAESAPLFSAFSYACPERVLVI